MALETQRRKLSQLAKVLTLTLTYTLEPQNILELTANLFLRGFHDSGPPEWNKSHRHRSEYVQYAHDSYAVANEAVQYTKEKKRCLRLSNSPASFVHSYT
jgi:hypothetical protein